jgi:hypothetical protein
MEDVMLKSTTSRRAVLAGAITMPLAAAAPALAGGDDGELLRLGAEVKRAYDALGDAIHVQSVAEEKWFRWQRSNPEPDEESAALANWQEREESVLRESGFDDADAAAKVASDKLQAAIKTLCDTRARSLRGLSAKARLCEIDPDALGHFLRPSIIADLRAMGGARS